MEREATLRLKELRGWINLVAGMVPSEIRAARPGNMPAVQGIQAAILDMLGRHLEQQNILLRRLESMLNALPDGVAVVNAEGLISLVNAAGSGLFEGLRPAVGKSVFEILSRHSLQAAIDRSVLAATPIAATLHTIHGTAIEAMVAALGTDGGVLLRYLPTFGERIGNLEQDLTLHDRAPPPAPLAPDHALSALPILALDTETTGLDPSYDRVLSIGAVRMVGSRLYRAAAINILVDPGRRIPARTIAVHGISNAIVDGAPFFREVAGEVETATRGLVLVGHHVDFDVAMIAAEMRRAGRDWSPAAALDVMLLHAGLFPEQTELSLDAMAAALGVSVIGRHSALGDALSAAELFGRLVPLLTKRGVYNLAQAQKLSAEAMKRLHDRGRGSDRRAR